MTEAPDSRARLDDVLTYQLDERDIELLEAEAAKEDTFARRFSDDPDKLDVWKEAAKRQTKDAPGLFERINQVQSVLAILRACLPEAKNLGELEQQTIDAAQRTAALNALTPDTSSYQTQATEIDRELSHVEDVLLEVERRVPLSFLRQKTDERDFGDMALAHYLRFQIQFLKIAPTSWSRIDLLISRLAAAREVSGVFRVRTADQVAELLSSCVPPSETAPHVRKAAIRFFANAAKRLDEFQHVDELFSSGVYVDILGYKLSLRYDYFDPAILFASAELNLAIEEWVEGTHGTSMRSLDPQFAQAREKVRKIFGRNEGNVSASAKPGRRGFSSQSDGPKRSNRPAIKSSKSSAGAARDENPIAWRKLVALAGIVIALLWAAPSALSWFRADQRGLDSVAQSEVSEISSMLLEAGWIGEGRSRIFIGKVDGNRWVLLNAEQRRAEGERIRERLGHRDVYAAFVYNVDMLVLNILDGELRYIE